MKTTYRMFLNEVGNYPLLSAAEEKELARRYKEEGDEDAREALINSNLRLVISIAKDYNNSHLEIMDLINEGALGLVTAVDKYDPELGYRFSTCATPWIKQAITKSIVDKGKSIRIPAHIYQQLNKYRQAITKLTTQDNPNPSVSQIAAYLNISEERVGELENWRYDVVSLSTPLGDESDDTLEEVQADEKSETPEQYTERMSDVEKIQAMLGKLKPRTRNIIKLRFGLGVAGDPQEYFEEHTLEEIGEIVNLTRERVRQIIKDTVSELKISWEK